jgi:hypothetical protein
MLTSELEDLRSKQAVSKKNHVLYNDRLTQGHGFLINPTSRLIMMDFCCPNDVLGVSVIYIYSLIEEYRSRSLIR